MSKRINLRKFKKEELIFNDKKTIQILNFIFKNRRHIVNNLKVNDDIREFAQAILLEAIDASYKLGFVESLFRITMNPGAEVKSIFKKFAKESAKHWFKNRMQKKLLEVKIYEIVRRQLELSFSKPLIHLSNGVALRDINTTVLIAYEGSDNITIAWC